MTELKFKIESFEGPIDLLVHLIRKNEIDISDIPIAEITSQYLEYIEIMKELDLEIAGEFIVLASTLLRIKSSMLLPKPPVENETDEDPRQELIDMIMEYKKYKQVADILDVRRDARELVFERGQKGVEEEFESTEEHLTVETFDLLRAFAQVLRKKRQLLVLARDEVRVDDRIRDIRTLLREKESLSFEELLTGSGSKISRQFMIATFLAILELVRMDEIVAFQDGPEAPINISIREGENNDEPT